MSYNISAIPSFKKEFKKLAKKYPSLKADLQKLSEELIENPTLGIDLGGNFYKVRMAITSKGRGKSGGARIITHVKIIETTIFLTSIYDKSDKDSISDKELNQLLNEIE
jgi:hypothetical protein